LREAVENDWNSMKRVWWAVTFLVLAGVGVVVYQTQVTPARAQTAPAAGPGVPVVVATVARQPMPVRIDTIGTVQTIAMVSIKSRVDGYIDSVLIRDGQFVKTGDIMFRLDSRSAEAQLKQAQAQLARDQASLEGAERDLRRYTELVAKHATPVPNLETAQTQVGVFKGAVKADEAAIENLQVQLSFCTIRAPIDGRVGIIAIKAGNSIKANDLPLATINQIQPIHIGFSLPQVGFPGLRAAMDQGEVEVSVRPQGDEGAPIKGLVEFFDSAVDTPTGTIAVRAKFANDELRLWPGQYVNASVTLGIEREALTVPQAAVRVGQGGNYVFVIKPDRTAEFRPVKVARTVDGKSVIASGVSEGEEVAVDGQLRLNNGTKVDIKKL
jgi:membrane fusion protein, multidrug efflux system